MSAHMPEIPTYPNESPEKQESPKEFLLQFFTYSHLPNKLHIVSAPFCELARLLVTELPRNPERTVALRKLLEAKDCAVRCTLAESEG